MERVLIVAKTHMATGVCVSGLTRTDNRSIRLVPKGRFNQPIDTLFEVGQAWDIGFQEDTREKKLPHVEDVIVTEEKYIRPVPNLLEILMQKVKPWKGGVQELFEGKLTLDGTKAYLTGDTGMPSCSTGYWLPNSELLLTTNTKYDKPYYHLEYRDTLIPYVGFEEPVSCIPRGTLVRVSLTRWWAPEGVGQQKCYLQLSGWYK